MTKLSKIERRLLAIIIGAGEARVEAGEIRIDRQALPATIVRALIRKGWLTRHAFGKGRPVIIRPSIAAAGLDKAGNLTSA